jgi:hypothetical protein
MIVRQSSWCHTVWSIRLEPTVEIQCIIPVVESYPAVIAIVETIEKRAGTEDSGSFQIGVNSPWDLALNNQTWL